MDLAFSKQLLACVSKLLADISIDLSVGDFWDFEFKGLLLYWFRVRKLEMSKLWVEHVTNPGNDKNDDFVFSREVTISIYLKYRQEYMDGASGPLFNYYHKNGA